jgi:transposase
MSTNIWGQASSDLTDEEWHTVQPLVPPRKTRGRPRADDRQVLNAIFFVLHTGCQWKEVPRERYGPYSTAANRLRTWKMDGTWDRLQQQLLLVLLRQHKLNLTSSYLDGSLIASKRGDARPAATALSAR